MHPMTRGRIVATLAGVILAMAVAGFVFGARGVGVLGVGLALTMVLGGLGIAMRQSALRSLRRAPSGRVRFPLYVPVFVGFLVAGVLIAAARRWENTYNHGAPAWVGPLAVVVGFLVGAMTGWILFGARVATERARTAFAERERLRRIRDARIARGAEPGQLSDAATDGARGELSLGEAPGTLSPPGQATREKA